MNMIHCALATFKYSNAEKIKKLEKDNAGFAYFLTYLCAIIVCMSHDNMCIYNQCQGKHVFFKNLESSQFSPYS